MTDRTEDPIFRDWRDRFINSLPYSSSLEEIDIKARYRAKVCILRVSGNKDGTRIGRTFKVLLVRRKAEPNAIRKSSSFRHG